MMKPKKNGSKMQFMPSIIRRRYNKHREDRQRRAQALRMLSQQCADVNSEAGSSGDGAITPGSISNGEGSKEFLSTGRTGRRNAMPDILGQHANTGTADLSTKFENLTTQTSHGEAETSAMDQGETSTSQQQMG